MSTYVSPSIAHAVEFLTQPLRTIYPPSQIVPLQRTLGTRLASLFFQQRSKLVISLLPGRTPPSALYMSCMSQDICWADWMTALGEKPFDLVVETDRVTTRSANGNTHLLWSNYPPSTAGEHRPLPRPSEPVPRIAPDMTHAPTRQRTLAQLILASPEEDREADELFASITDAIISGPTSTQQSCSPMTSSCMTYSPCNYVSPKTYPHKILDDLSPPITRPSSRSSATSSSTSTFSSVTDDSSTFTSPLTSPGYATRPFEHTQLIFKPTPPFQMDSQFHHRHLAHNVPPSSAPRRRHVAAPSFAARRPPRFSTPAFAQPPAPIKLSAQPNTPCLSPIDPAKFEKTKYLYQGGVSTVLTGGVMLGGGTGGVKTRTPHSSNQTWGSY